MVTSSSCDASDVTDIIIGSGPAGVSVATALLARGRTVLMLDGGKTLEAANRARRDDLAAMSPDDWTPDEVEAYQAGQFETPPGQVRRFGSDFAMEPAGATLAASDSLALRASRAVGGLSNLWGAAVLPYQAKDIADWPVTVAELLPHYRAVSDFMPIAGQKDALEDLLPAFAMQGRTPLPPTPQAEMLLKRVARHGPDIATMGLHIGAARQAVDAGCRQCGLCLHGCPWGYIYSAAQTVDELKQKAGFTHRPGAMVQRFNETADGVEVVLEGGEVMGGKRLFIAAGVLETARIVLTSRPENRGDLPLLDSPYFFLPMLHRWTAPRPPDRLPHNTLPQLFAEIDDAAVSPHLVHAQIYTWNAFYARDLIASYGRKLPGSAPLWRMLAKRLIVAQVFLHSVHSPRISIRLESDRRLSSSIKAHSDKEIVTKGAKSVLRRGFNRLGLTALGFATRAGAPGSSFHVGGSMPMSSNPGPDQTDILGRPKGLTRVHLVDASVFPTIPATTITFSVMANAHRIGSNAPDP